MQKIFELMSFLDNNYWTKESHAELWALCDNFLNEKKQKF